MLMRVKLKHLLRKILLPSLYKRYVVTNSVIQDDIMQTLAVRGSKMRFKSLDKQFYHLMQYYPEFAFLFFWRINSRPWYYSWFAKDFQCKIFRSTKIGGGLVCYHPFATVINAKSIGRNFQFRNGLTIGNKGNDNTLLPVIGDDVTVGANVVIIGNISIGDHVIIGAGAVVVKDVPSHCVIAGNPARIIRKLIDE